LNISFEAAVLTYSSFDFLKRVSFLAAAFYFDFNKFKFVKIKKYGEPRQICGK